MSPPGADNTATRAAFKRTAVAVLYFVVCLLITACAEFLDSAVQSQLDQNEVSRNAHHYENHGQDAKTARENAQFDFIQQHDRFP